MRTKGFIFFLTLAMLMGIFPVNAMAFSDVDLSRVKFSTGKETLLFEFGNISIEGELKQEYPFTREDIDKIVGDTLRATGLTESDIKSANSKVEKARRATDFTQEDIERIKENIFVSMETVPAAGNVAALLRMIDGCMKSSSWDDIGTASADLLEKAMTAKVKETASGFVDRAGELGENVNKRFEWMENLTAIVTFSDMLADAQAHDRQKWQDIAAGAEAKRLLNDFYEVLEDKIENYKNKSDKAGWSIVFDEAMDNRRFTFFGVDDNDQYWYLNMTLKQINTNEYGSIAGDYEGEYTVTAEHIMTGFTSRADEALLHMDEIGDGIKKLLNTPEVNAELKATSKGSAYISRTISGSCKATIEESGNINLTLHEDKDETQVNITGVAAELKLSFDGSGVIKNEGTMPFQISADKEEIKISGMTYKMTGKSELPSGQNFNFSQTLGGGGAFTVGWDDNIWKPWNGTQKTLKFAGN
ncbi:MAG: hypothetical protein AB7E30_08430 [Lawsonibacter sp.]